MLKELAAFPDFYLDLHKRSPAALTSPPIEHINLAQFEHLKHVTVISRYFFDLGSFKGENGYNFGDFESQKVNFYVKYRTNRYCREAELCNGFHYSSFLELVLIRFQ